MVLITRAIVLTLLVCQNTVITLPWRKSVIDKIPTFFPKKNLKKKKKKSQGHIRNKSYWDNYRLSLIV